ncbi:indolepyruvate ferredoxin oxidoreductase beta subunit [Methanococcus maripaludis]|uniref:Indolepyruvate ferredoxin oxidoreductase beta subunit n=1 Tax=Methanococcus maripaludis TaxID=39152 RepID=A0A7J9PSI7_METMI|nr:indolepyruvate oxidoreductase subunit beta [Methanococcus maripaludis]MBA2840719.1 indolepyruvate ferredoxin oxidoreductase beta subunit [Methanococcus maripaludis]MBA2853162.1 indolepyruvate ferredoxin oxidoreductase beta subunit [Methanococcus maripaludis]MBA2869116.1 indolepyruvate ferredoxin oxidoreductase beta subunit [Methanococcus maripaludis]
MNFSVIICGVGGQGVVLASRLLAITAMNSGFHVNTAETLGMSQREGSVVSHLQFGETIKSSLIPEGGADLIIGLELSEVARNLHFLKKNGKIITNCKMILPSARSSNETYDSEQIINFINKYVKSSICIDFSKIAKLAGNPKSMNVSVLSAAFYTGFLPLDYNDFLKTIESEIPEKYRDINLNAAKLSAETIMLEGNNE